MSDQNDAMVTLTGLWANTSKAGNKYLSGSIGLAKVFVFPVKNPTENGPTHRLVIGERQQQSESSSGSGGYDSAPPVTDEDIPF